MADSSAARKHSNTRRPFTVDEDAKLMEIMNHQEFVSWDMVASQMPDRSSRQCRERWVNYLSPNIRNDPWTDTEDQLLLEKINEMGRCWSNIGHFFNGRSENDVKNRWYSHLKYRIMLDATGKYQFVTDPSQSLYPDRKKRNRTKISPQKNALRILEQKKLQEKVEEDNLEAVVQEEPMSDNIQVEALKDEEPTFVDCFDKSLLDEYVDYVIEHFEMNSVSLSNSFIFD